MIDAADMAVDRCDSARFQWIDGPSGNCERKGLRSAAMSAAADEAADADDGPSNAPALLELRDAMSLAWRMLLLWLAVLAVFVLAGLVN